MREPVLRLRYRYWPDHVLGEILSKRWMETAIPVIVLLIVAFALSQAIPNFLSPPASPTPAGRRRDRLRRARHGAGHDRRRHRPVGRLDVRADEFLRPVLPHVLKWPVPAVAVVTIAFGALLGAVNGVLIGYFRLRAFLTTLITLIIYRALYDLLLADYSTAIAAGLPDIASWDFIGNGTGSAFRPWRFSTSRSRIFGHVFLTRLRPGWHVTAIGGSRRSAYNTGIAVRRTIALCYVASGVLTAVGALFFASRLGTAGGDIGVSLEVTVLTAAVLGGISLGGGKGSVMKALVGTLIVLLIINGLTTLSVRAASTAWCWPASCWSPR